MLVAPPIVCVAVFLCIKVASSVGTQINIHSLVGLSVVLVFAGVVICALLLEAYAVPVAVRALVRERNLRTVRNVVAIVFGVVGFVGGAAWFLL